MSDSLSDLSPCSPTTEPMIKHRQTEHKGCSDLDAQPRKRKHSYLTQKVC